ncbi:MAG: oxygen-independent coproporphyrinogen III oxidase [bacterium]
MLTDMDADMLKRLVRKYSPLYAMYVEYPHKSFWAQQAGDEKYRAAMKNMFSRRKDTPLMLYIHIPFCRHQCFYCTCHTYFTDDYEKVKGYMDCLYREIDILAGFLEKNSVKANVREIHLGGGSPTILREKEFDQLIKKIQRVADIKKLDEFAIEIDPREVDKEKMKYYHSKGINRVSFGVQEFDSDVQKAINRVQPRPVTEVLLEPDIRKYFNGVNFDIMWGLPRQTRESFRKTIDTVMELSPDRISLLLLHYAPELKKHQKLMKKSELPDVCERAVIFYEAVQTLVRNGYVRIGFEHLAKPDDVLSKALKERTLYWNSLGYTAGRYHDIIGLGTGSSGNIANNCYFQNVYSLSEYEAAVMEGRFPVSRGYKLNTDDVIRRDIIHSLRSYFSVDYGDIGKKYELCFMEYFKKEMAALKRFADDSLLEISDGAINVTEIGKNFISHICRVFDGFSKDETFTP